MDLSNLELVFLNCCHTGGGRIYAGGLVGLARAFLIAGARQVVAYRGKLPDEEHTIDFVKCFYKEYFRSRRAEDALASAQSSASKAGALKEFWAAYYLMKRHN